MTRRALSLILALALAFTCVPSRVLAAGASAPKALSAQVPGLALARLGSGLQAALTQPGFTQAPDPRLAALLERAQGLPMALSLAGQVPALPATVPQAPAPSAQVLAAAVASLEGLTPETIRGMPLERLDTLARTVWDRIAPDVSVTREARQSDEDEEEEVKPPPDPGALKPAGKGRRRASPKPPPPPVAPEDKGYVRTKVSEARFGTPERQALLAQAYGLRERINTTIIGQDPAARVLQDKVVQYLEGLGTRKKEPVALHMIGLPGIGKSVMVDHLEALGISLLRIDAQRYTNPRHSLAEDLHNALDGFMAKPENQGKPFLIVLEELDKLPEKNPSASYIAQENSRDLVGTLNQILSEGKLPNYYPGQPPLDLSNVMVLTTMNLSPSEIERFSEEVLKTPKNFYDYTVDDFAKFDEWLRTESSARYKILSRLFRSNTVSRIAPNSIMLRPLDRSNYRELARRVIDIAVARATTGVSEARRLQASYTDAFLDFVAELTSFAPSGARENVLRADALTEQLLHYGTRAVGPQSSLDLPRRLKLDYDPVKKAAVISVTPRRRQGRDWKDGETFSLEVAFDASVGFWVEPKGLALTPPPPPKSRAKENKEKPITKKQILEARFPRTQNAARGLAQKIDQQLMGQERYTKLVEREMNAYLGRPTPAVKEPSSLVFAGFPGIGKTEIVRLAGQHLGLPVIRLNMQAFSSDDPGVVTDFMDTLISAVEKAKREKGWNGKYIVLLEELDKVFELNLDGTPKNRPIMALIKDLLNDGQVAITSKTDFGSQTRRVDLRDAFLFLTMNFSIDRFGFKADPRQTSISDVMEAWKKLTTRLADMKKVMGAMFLPETVSRLMSRLHIMAPLSAEDYRRVIDLQTEAVIRERLYDKEGNNRGLISLKLSPAYRRYLFSETVVPSEGPRHTSVSSRIKIATDLETALKNLKKTSSYATKPITVVLDFKPGRSTVVGSVVAAEKGAKPVEVFRQQVPLFFPSLRARGRMEQDRLKTAVHEFGHAFVAVRLGRRFEYATVVQPEEGVGGYVKFNDKSATAKAHMASVYSGLGSRAMERIFLSPDPASERSVMDVTSGPSMDIKMVTMELYDMLFELAMDPNGGTMDRLGVIGMTRYADFASLPPDLVERLGRVLREMENHIVADLLAAHPREWYVDKITTLARSGGMEEAEFYEAIGYAYPGKEPVNIGEVSRLQESFKSAIKPVPAEAKAAQEFRQGGGTTVLENVSAYTQRFLEIVEGNLRDVRPGARARAGRRQQPATRPSREPARPYRP